MSFMEQITAAEPVSIMAALAEELREALFRIEESDGCCTGDIEIAHAIARIIARSGGASPSA